MSRTEYFRFNAAAKYGSDIYFSNYQYNALYVLKGESNKPEYICKFPNEEFDVLMLHKSCIRVENILCFIPENAVNIHIYNLETGKMSAIYIKRYKFDVKAISEMILYGNQLIAFPVNYKEPIRIIDVDTFELKEDWSLSVWFEENIENIENREGIQFTRIARHKDIFWTTVYNTNKLLKMDLLNKQYQIIETPIKNSFGAFAGKNGIWISSNNSDEVCAFFTDDLSCKLYEKSEENETRYFNHLIEVNDSLYLIPAFDKKIQKLNIGNGSRSVIGLTDGVIDLNIPAFFGFDIIDGDIALFAFNNASIVYIKSDDSIVYRNIERDEYVYSKFPYKYYFNDKVNFETEKLQLEDFIDYIK